MIPERTWRNSLWIVLFLALSASFMMQMSLADDQSKDNDYSGSEYRSSSYEDTHFAKQDYSEIKLSNAAQRRFRREHSLGALKKAAELVKSEGKEASSLDEEQASKAESKNDRDERERVMRKEAEAKLELISGWVPDKVDSRHNGGFSIAPDNGRPVPYRLNGHLDLERERP